MSHYHRMAGFSLSKISLSTRVLLTLFLIFVLGGLGVALLQYHDRAGLTHRGAQEWIMGNEDDAAPTEFKAEQSYRELLSLTHDHAFSLPMLLLILLHLVALTGLGESVKIGLYLTGFASFGSALAAPWLIRYAGEQWTWLLRIAGLGLAATIAFSAGITLIEMWRPRPNAVGSISDRRGEGTGAKWPAKRYR